MSSETPPLRIVRLRRPERQEPCCFDDALPCANKIPGVRHWSGMLSESGKGD